MPRTIATTRTASREEVLEFARARHHHVLMTTRSDGSVQASPVTAGVDPQGRVVIASYPERASRGTPGRTGTASVLVLRTTSTGPGVQIDGDAARGARRARGRRTAGGVLRWHAGEHSDWDDYRARDDRPGKCLIRITPTAWSPIATGGFPPRLANGLSRRGAEPAGAEPGGAAGLGPAAQPQRL